ncbi:MAG TPA: urease accessory protein UreF [Burkholderiales bacterium]|nr:urease accessory protein UreF [Burkholderiales bacterium]
MKSDRDLTLARLLQLASPALPVGAYSYSQGLESAVDSGIVHDAASAERWIAELLDFSVARMEGPVLLRLHAAWSTGSEADAARWNRLILASRESAELRAESVQMGYSLSRLLAELGEGGGLAGWEEVSFTAAYAYAASSWGVGADDALVAYLWTWAENQVMAAVKAVPLGQSAAQKMLLALGEAITAAAVRARSLDDEGLGNYAPGLALLSARHETQYSRLFRS